MSKAQQYFMWSVFCVVTRETFSPGAFRATLNFRKFMVALNPNYRIFLNVAISCILLCLSQFDNKLVRQSQIVQNAIDSSGTVYSILIQGPKKTYNFCLLWCFTLFPFTIKFNNTLSRNTPNRFMLQNRDKL